MSIYEAMLVALLMLLALTLYAGYWVSWCWVWQNAWPTGPEWFIRPNPVGFLLTCITGVIITIMILSKASDT